MPHRRKPRSFLDLLDQATAGTASLEGDTIVLTITNTGGTGFPIRRTLCTLPSKTEAHPSELAANRELLIRAWNHLPALYATLRDAGTAIGKYPEERSHTDAIARVLESLDAGGTAP